MVQLNMKIITVKFYQSSSGNEPVKEGLMILLHAFKKKSQKTPPNELDIAKNRRDQVLNV